MSRFGKELSIIPATAWVIALLAYLGITSPLFFYVLPHDPEMGQWPRWGQALFVYGIFLLLVAFVALVGCQAAPNARGHVDAAGHFRPRYDRHYSLFHLARPAAKALPWLRKRCQGRLRFLSALRDLPPAKLPELRTGG
jgi:hypothetical protein